MDLTPELREKWLRNGIVSRDVLDADTCEEVVRDCPDIVFVLTRVGDTRWVLSGVRDARPVRAVSVKQTTMPGKRAQRYAQYE